jgi:hypothetical protein
MRCSSIQTAWQLPFVIRPEPIGNRTAFNPNPPFANIVEMKFDSIETDSGAVHIGISAKFP